MPTDTLQVTVKFQYLDWLQCYDIKFDSKLVKSQSPCGLNPFEARGSCEKRLKIGFQPARQQCRVSTAKTNRSVPHREHKWIFVWVSTTRTEQEQGHMFRLKMMRHNHASTTVIQKGGRGCYNYISGLRSQTL